MRKTKATRARNIKYCIALLMGLFIVLSPKLVLPETYLCNFKFPFVKVEAVQAFGVDWGKHYEFRIYEIRKNRCQRISSTAHADRVYFSVFRKYGVLDSYHPQYEQLGGDNTALRLADEIMFKAPKRKPPEQFPMNTKQIYEYAMVYCRPKHPENFGSSRHRLDRIPWDLVDIEKSRNCPNNTNPYWTHFAVDSKYEPPAMIVLGEAPPNFKFR